MADAPHLLRAKELLAARSVRDLPSVDSLTKGGDAHAGALLEAAFLVASADGSLSKEEVGSLIDLVAQMGEGVTPGELAGHVYEFSEALEREGRKARIDAIAAHVADPGARREILGFATLVALSDHDLAPSELFVLHSIGKGFGLDGAAVNAIVKTVAEGLGVTGLGK